MSLYFEELDWKPTPIGPLSLRRRRELKLGVDVYEILLGDAFLMSSLFTAAEIALARLALAKLPGSGLDVVVGGLGLGYTAQAVLEDARVQSLIVVEALEPVIDWHRRQLLPVGDAASGDPRCRLVHGDFFALAGAAAIDPDSPGRRFHAILVDIDHSPRHVLHPSHAGFYRHAGLSRLVGQLHPGGLFALWSNDPPDDDFTALLASIFATAEAQVVSFHNPLQNRPAANTVYLASLAS